MTEQSAPETPYVGWRRDFDRGMENWHLIGDVMDVGGIRWVEAEARTGSRYVVCVTPLPDLVQKREGGKVLVSVVWPWQDCKVMQSDSYLDVSYVAEHLTDGRNFDRRLNGGDLAALTMTVRHALGRTEN